MSRKIIIGLTLCLGLMLLPGRSEAQVTEIIGIVKGAIKKVITALDLEVQQLQTQTIALQDAQRVVENTMSELKLNDISSWLSQEKGLYQEYYGELAQIKGVISDYERIKQIIQKQTDLVSSYKTAYGLLQQDKHFSSQEVSHMYSVYSGIIQQSVDNLNEIILVLTSLATTMTDAQRWRIIDGAADKIDKNYSDLQRFTQANELVSLQRAKDVNDMDEVKLLYGLQ